MSDDTTSTTPIGGDLPESLVAAIARQTEGLDVTQITAVLTAWNTVTTGDPVGTVCRDPETGFVAHRVLRNGVPVWHVSAPDGGHWGDTQPSFPGWVRGNFSNGEDATETPS